MNLNRKTPLEKMSAWLSGWVSATRVAGGIVVLVAAFFITKTFLSGAYNYSGLLDKSYQEITLSSSPLITEFTFEIPKTKSLADLFADTIVQDRDRYHLRLGFYRYIEKMNLSEATGWKGWKKTLPKKELSCKKSDDPDQCKKSTPYFTTLGAWSLLTLTACRGTKEDNLDFWKQQSEAVKVLLEDPLTSSQNQTSRILFILKSRSRKEMCRVSEKIVFRNL